MEKIASEYIRANEAKRIVGFSDRNLRQFRQFYLAYPQIWQTLSAKFNMSFLTGKIRIHNIAREEDFYNDLMLPLKHSLIH
jgi:hypothetical protein